MGFLPSARGYADRRQCPRGLCLVGNMWGLRGLVRKAEACGQNVSEMPIRVKVEGRILQKSLASPQTL